MTKAQIDGTRDGNEWDLAGIRLETLQHEGWDEATINAIGTTACGANWGVTEQDEGWSEACREYNDAVYAAVKTRLEVAS